MPRRMIAIFYDVEHTPICMESWIEETLQNILSQCEKKQDQNTGHATTRYELWKTKRRLYHAIAARLAKPKSTTISEKDSYISTAYFSPSFMKRVISSLISLTFSFAKSSSFFASVNSFIKSG